MYTGRATASSTAAATIATAKQTASWAAMTPATGTEEARKRRMMPRSK